MSVVAETFFRKAFAVNLIHKEVLIMKEISKAKTTVESFAKEKSMGSASCDHIKCKLCQY